MSEKRLLEELNNIASTKNTKHIIESRANNIINSAINLLTLLKETYTIEEYKDLESRLLGAIKDSNPKKFSRCLDRISK